MRVLVTGAGGTLGRALAPALAHKGHEPVLFDIQAFETPYPVVQGDIRSLSTWSHPSLSPWTMAPSSGATPSRSSIGNGRGARRLPQGRGVESLQPLTEFYPMQAIGRQPRGALGDARPLAMIEGVSDGRGRGLSPSAGT